MAENEYLNSTRSRRWQRVAEGLRDDCDIAELSLRTQKCFYKTLDEMRKDLPLSELIEAIGQPDRLSELFDQIEGAEITKDFLMQAAQVENEPANAVVRFLGKALENLLYDIPHLAAKMDSSVNVSAARGRLDAVRSELAPDLIRMAQKFVENPAWKPRRPPSKSSSDSTPAERTGKMLGESLIAGFRQ